MPNRLMLKTFTRAHMFWYRLSGGVIGGRVGKARFLLLTTTGRKSGAQHQSVWIRLRHLSRKLLSFR